jgi:hypothetical protein
MNAYPVLTAAAAAFVGAEFSSFKDCAADPVNPSADAATASQPKSTQPLTDEDREIAIIRAGKLVEVLIIDRDYRNAVYEATGHLADKGEADRADLLAKDAHRIMVALINGRSAAQLLKLARAAL